MALACGWWRHMNASHRTSPAPIGRIERGGHVGMAAGCRASRTGRACRPRAPASSMGGAASSATRCRRPRRPGRPAVPRTTACARAIPCSRRVVRRPIGRPAADGHDLDRLRSPGAAQQGTGDPAGAEDAPPDWLVVAGCFHGSSRASAARRQPSAAAGPTSSDDRAGQAQDPRTPAWQPPARC